MTTSVFVCSRTNSQMFTICCKVAVCDDQNHCPKCGEEVEPRGGIARWGAAKQRNPDRFK